MSTQDFNPGCEADEWCHNSTYNSEGMLSYATAVGPEDTLHHLFCTVGAPTLMISRINEKNAAIEINYDVLLNQTDAKIQAINFTSKPEHSLGIIFSAVSDLK